MEQANEQRASTRRVPVRRIAAAALAIGGLSVPVFAAGTAGAATSQTMTSNVISTAKNAKLGTIIVSGKTVYTLKASKTPCTAQCLKIWPEVTLPQGVTTATAGAGVSAGKLGTVARPGGVLQVTYSGKPLYWFFGDKAAGQVHGNITDKWGKWSSVVTAKAAKPISGTGGTSSTNAGTGGASF